MFFEVGQQNGYPVFQAHRRVTVGEALAACRGRQAAVEGQVPQARGLRGGHDETPPRGQGRVVMIRAEDDDRVRLAPGGQPREEAPDYFRGRLVVGDNAPGKGQFMAAAAGIPARRNGRDGGDRHTGGDQERPGQQEGGNKTAPSISPEDPGRDPAGKTLFFLHASPHRQPAPGQKRATRF